MSQRNPGIDVSVLARATCDPGGILPDMRQKRTYISLCTFPIACVLRIRGANTMRIVLESRGTNARILQYGFNGNWKLHRATCISE